MPRGHNASTAASSPLPALHRFVDQITCTRRKPDRKSTFLPNFSQRRREIFDFVPRRTRATTHDSLGRDQLNIHYCNRRVRPRNTPRTSKRNRRVGVQDLPDSLRARNRSPSSAEFQVAACYSKRGPYETNLRRPQPSPTLFCRGHGNFVGHPGAAWNPRRNSSLYVPRALLRFSRLIRGTRHGRRDGESLGKRGRIGASRIEQCSALHL